MKKLNVEAEGSELILKNSHGDYAIIPVKDRNKVLHLLNTNKHSEIDSYVNTLPVASDYASDGSLLLKPNVTPEPNFVKADPFNPYSKTTPEKSATYKETSPKYVEPEVITVKPKYYGSVSRKPVEANSFTNSLNIDVVQAGNVLRYAKDDYSTKTINPKYSGCVEGMCRDMAKVNKKDYDDMRKLNNLYGSPEDLLNNAYGKDIYDKNKDQFVPSTVSVNDIVVMSKNSNPAKDDHVGRISKIVDNVPYVKHYINEDIGYLEEPLNDISKYESYTPSRIKRIRDYDPDIVLQKGNFQLNSNYEPTAVEADVLKGMNNKEFVQNKLKLKSDEYDRLAKLAYGIIGAESDFGASKRIAYRMILPDFIQKDIKITKDLFKESSDTYDENINNLSQGYGSNKESSQFTVGRTDKSPMNMKQMREDIRDGNFKDYNRNTSYNYHAFNQLGINPDKLENGETSFYAVMATLSQYIKKNPDITHKELIQKYTGKTKNVDVYKSKVDKYLANFDGDLTNDVQRDKLDNFYAWLSDAANKGNAGLKQIKDEALTKLRDISPLADNVDQVVYDLLAADEDFTEKSMDKPTYDALKNIVKQNLKAGKTTIDYEDYSTSKNAYDDVNKKVVKVDKMLKNENYILKTLIGAGRIIDNGDGTVDVVDQYNFNDKGKSFGFIDDLRKRGYDSYQIVRSLSRNFGSREGQGSKVKIKINLND